MRMTEDKLKRKSRAQEAEIAIKKKFGKMRSLRV